MRQIIDIDQLAEWCVPVRMRGRLIETCNPLREDMSVLDVRLKRSAYKSETELAKARTELLDQMLDRIFIGHEWDRLKAAIADESEPPLSPFEKLTIVLHYTMAFVAVTHGAQAAEELSRRGINLIEPEPIAKPDTNTNLPDGQVVGGDGVVRPIQAEPSLKLDPEPKHKRDPERAPKRG